MVSLKELEKQRLEKIGSLNESQIKNYVDVLVKDICRLHDFNSVTNADERLNEIADLYEKLKEINEITGGKFNNINNYINITLNSDLVVALTVEVNKYIVNDANSKNLIISLHLKDILTKYADFKMYTALLYDLLFDFKELSDVAPDVSGSKKAAYIDVLKIPILTLKDEIEKEIALLDAAFYSDETIVNDIQDLKLTIKNLAESGDDNDKIFVEFDLIDVLVALIKAYENHAEIKELYLHYKAEIDEVFADSDNVFKKYSAAKFESVDDDSGITFNDFMKSEPKFNIDSGELISP